MWRAIFANEETIKKGLMPLSRYTYCKLCNLIGKFNFEVPYENWVWKCHILVVHIFFSSHTYIYIYVNSNIDGVQVFSAILSFVIPWIECSDYKFAVYWSIANCYTCFYEICILPLLQLTILFSCLFDLFQYFLKFTLAVLYANVAPNSYFQFEILF